MAFSIDERARIRYHLGYLNTNVGPSIGLGLISASQLMFILESAMDTFRPEAESTARRAVAELDCIEDQMSESRTNYATTRVAEISFDTNQEWRLADQYLNWARTLADMFGVPINPFSKRHQFFSGDGPTVLEPM